MKALVLAILVAACFPPSPAPNIYHADPGGELNDPAMRAILVDRAARDLACDPSAVVVRAFATPKQSYVNATTVEYTSLGFAVVEGNGQRVTYAVMPKQFDDRSGWKLFDDDLVIVAHIPVIASAPPSPDEGGSDDTGSN
ncbi:MAG TPA: hypothetical protein VH143_01975 [Kofleriaceae bacterium]|jgi:hypothetical protein|nr:hypothetical protein [Kofleriaceae bacterium]